MTQQERRIFLLRTLLAEQPQYRNMEIPQSEQAQKQLLRALFNVRMPRETDEEFLRIQDEYLKTEIAQKGVTDYRSLASFADGVYLWKGDITTLRCDAVVNAANRQMLGCFYPNHGCIDNAIHTYAGVQLRSACAALMETQGHAEQTGMAKITPAFNLPSKYVIHTVGPVVHDSLSGQDRELLASCYRSCLAVADENGLESIAFCCISTGEFHFPNEAAAEIAIQAVSRFREKSSRKIEVIFNVFKELDYEIYRKLLGGYKAAEI
ncbi:MAG: protein-ADP-ribose hydrolase [Clostridia bacterium]